MCQTPTQTDRMQPHEHKFTSGVFTFSIVSTVTGYTNSLIRTCRTEEGGASDAAAQSA